MRKLFIRIPLTFLLLWLSWLGVSQWQDSREGDWSEDYLRDTVTIVGSRVDYWSSSNRRKSATCRLVVEWNHEGKTYNEEPVWLTAGMSMRGQLPKDCGRERFGEEVPVWIAGLDAADPVFIQPGDRSSQGLTGSTNLVQAVFFLALAALLWRRPRKNETAGSQST